MNKKRLRGAIIGYGFVASKGHIPGYLERNQTLDDVEIVALADVSVSRRTLAAAVLPEARVYCAYQDLLKEESAHLDFVDVATPPHDHAAIARAALSRGVHVLCEKPLTCTTEEARALLDHARQVQRVIFPCHNYKHAPMIKAIGEIICSGRIGRVRSVTLNTYRNTHAKGVKEWNSHWRRESRYSGGGIAMDHGSHSLYLTFDWLGSYPTSVTANMSNLACGKYDTEDEFSAELDFPTGIARVYLTWTAGVRRVNYVIEGEHGVITMEDDALTIETHRNGHVPSVSEKCEEKSIRSCWEDASHASWFNSLFDEFRKAIDDREFAGKDAQEALLCIETINTAYRSAREGSRKIMISSAMPELRRDAHES
jgi:myo-inositol 2-dehydrogenase / D-chiro-inositol 1-dehydrogenase